MASILREERNATLEIFKNLKIVRFINRFDKPCIRVYANNDIKPIAASSFRDGDELERRVNQLKNDASITLFNVVSFKISGALIWRDKIRGLLNGKLPDGFTTSSNNLDNLVFLLNDYSNLL